MTDPGSRRAASPAVPRRRLGACLGLALAATLGGCERGLCPAAVFEVDIIVRLSAEWPAREDLRITVGCPESEECGFLRGPVTGDAMPFTTVSTVLRPPEIDVLVEEAATGRALAHDVLPVEYVPIGRQNRCGKGPASAEVTVPREAAEATDPAAPGR